MPWYRSGTVAITAGQTSVVGTNTNFAANARVGDAFQGPDGRWYEVSNIASATVLSILPAYQGATVSAGGYGLAPMQGYVKDSADALRAIVNQYGNKLAALGTTGNYDVLPVAKGGTGGTTASDARSGLGLGTVATESIVPVAKGGTGGATAAAARAGLELGTAAVANLGFTPGQVARAEALGYAQNSSSTKNWYTDLDQGFDPVLYAPGAPNAPTGGTGYWYKQTIRFGTGGNRLMIAWPYGLTGITGTIKMWSVYNGEATPMIELYHTGNTTRAADGTLKAI